MPKQNKKLQKKSCKATEAQKKRMEKAESFFLRKGFRSFRRVCQHLKIDQSRGRKAFLGISQYGETLSKKEMQIKKQIEQFIGFEPELETTTGEQS